MMPYRSTRLHGENGWKHRLPAEKKKKKIKMILEMIISVEYATYAVVKINPEKNFRLASIRTRIPVPGRGGAPDFK